MRNLLISLLVVFLLVDVFLAVTLFYPNLTSSIVSMTPSHEISVSSTIPNMKVSLTNEKYLNKKLSKLNFWGEKKVANYARAQLEYVTVERLKFILTDKPQVLALRDDSNTAKNVQYSYGQLYDPSTKTTTLLLYLNPSLKSDLPLSFRYTGLALLALFDTTHPRTPNNSASYEKSLISFMPEFVEKPGKNSIFKIN